MTDLTLPLGQLRIPHFPVPDGHTVETWLREECQRGLERRYGTVTPGAPDAARLRARRDPLDGLRRLLPDRGRLHRVRPRAEGIQTTCRGIGAGLDRDLHAGHHPGRPDPLPAPVRALPQPRPRDDARHRRRLRGRADATRSSPTSAASTARTTSPRSSPSARCSPGPRSATSAASSATPTARSTGSPRPSRTSSGSSSTRRSRPRADLRGHGRRRPGGQADHRLRPPSRGRRPQRLDPRRRRRHQPRAADRADAAPEGDQLGRADDPVRDARDRGARPAQVRLPGPVEPDDPAPGGRPRPRPTAAIEIDLDDIPLDDATTFELLASGETTGVFQLESAGMRRYIRELRPTSVYDLAAMVALYPARARWTTSRPTSGASTARSR